MKLIAGQGLDDHAHPLPQPGSPRCLAWSGRLRARHVFDATRPWPGMGSLSARLVMTDPPALPLALALRKVEQR